MLKITLVSGQVQEVPFSATSTLSVTNQGFVDGVATPIQSAYSEIASLEIVPDPVEEVATIVQEDPPAPPVPTSGLPVDTNAVTTEPTSGAVDDVLTPIQDDTVTGVEAPVTTSPSGLLSVTLDNAPDGTTVTPAPVDGGGVVIPPDADVVVPAPDPEPPAEPDTSNPQVDAQPALQSVGEALAAAPATGDPGDETTAPTEPTDVDPPVADPPPALVDAVNAAGAVVDAAVSDPAAHIDHLAQAQVDVDQALVTWPDDPNLLDLKTQLADLAADAAEASSTSDAEPPAAA